MAGKATRAGIQAAANRIGCNTATLRAVLAVETAGRGFFTDGRPVILFERHVFSRLTSRMHDGLAPDISNPIAGGYLGMEREYGRLYKAAQFDADVAAMSCSWGIGQIMGFNYEKCGEKSLIGFLLAMHNSEDVQLLLMAQFILNTGDAALDLKTRNWAGFAKAYNGRDYARNSYDVRLAKAYDVAVKQEAA